ncbi:helicase C-terminal domain-containing protein [Candidatus Hydrogenedentota bacterium]
MSDVHEYIDHGAIELIRREIALADGNEVFFRGVTDGNKVVVGAEVCARGHEGAVSAFDIMLDPGDIMIHNHPGGNLIPSDNDIMIASEFAREAIGSFIVDNEVENIYVIVEPMAPVRTSRLETRDMVKLFADNGPVARSLVNFERRPCQSEMLKTVTQAFNDNGVGLIEAGTGTGKTMAYLIPAVYWATMNDERVVVSTNTINLQEQLMRKDIPFLQRTLDRTFTAALIKGRGNYVCKRKLDSVARQEQLLLEDEFQLALADVQAWAGTTTDGSREDLSFNVPHELWETVCSESDTCAYSRCQYYSNTCFVTSARRKAAYANILVVNHHLLFADLQLRWETGSKSTPILPRYERIILDEAHNVEDVATSYFGESLTRFGLVRRFGRLVRAKRGATGKTSTKGILPFVSALVSKKRELFSADELDRFDKTLTFTLLPLLEILREKTDDFFDEVYKAVDALAEPAPGNERKLRLTEERMRDGRWQAVFAERGDNLCKELCSAETYLQELVGIIARAVKKGDPKDELASQITELRAAAGRIGAAADQIRRMFKSCEEEKVYWVETGMTQRGKRIGMHISPLLVGPVLAERLYPEFATVIMTSATLTTGGKFDYLKKRTGVDHIEPDRVIESALPSPFDFKEQVLIGIPDEMPPPNLAGFEAPANKFILDCVKLTGGRTFVLFTSYGSLNRSFKELAPALEDDGIIALKQGSESRSRLLEKFRSDDSSVLFATSSFWEGVDVQGRSLESVILVRLPFRVPTEPVLEARVEEIQKHGGNPFMEYSVPQAVIKFRQGFGRLIRTRNDRGVVIVLDNRILTKFYGRIFLKSLPECNQVIGNNFLVLSRMRQFFKGFGD